MIIRVSDTGNTIEVSLGTDSHNQELAARFPDMATAMEFAEDWADWIGCAEVEVTRSSPPPALNSAA